MLTFEVSVRLIRECQYTVDTNQLIHWRRIQVEYHLPTWLHMHIFSLFWNFTTRPVSWHIPVSYSVLESIFCDLLIAWSNAPVTNLVDCLLLVWVAWLIFTIYNDMCLTNCSLIVNDMLTKGPIARICRDGIILDHPSILLAVNANFEINCSSDISPVVH